MRNVLRLTRAAVLLAALAAPALGRAQASAQIRLDLPLVLPQLVVVSPGVQVVPDVEEEVFYSSGWYWVRQDGGWYRSHSPRRGWMFVEPERVPHRLVNLPPGQYRRWHPPPPPPRAAPVRFRGPAGPRGPEAVRWGGDDRGEHRRGDDDRGDHRGGGRGHGHGEGRGHGDRD
ncbi:MAG TPA: hypothetical protein VF841_16060 [Anaeromyxobacter sp.]